MEPELDVAFHSVLKKVLTMDGCEAASILLLDTGEPTAVLTSTVLGIREYTDYIKWTKEFLRSGSVNRLGEGLIEQSVAIDVVVTARETGFSDSATTSIVRLLKTGSLDLLLLVHFTRGVEPRGRMLQFVENLRQGCALAINRFIMRKSIACSGQEIDFVGCSEPFERLESQIKRVANSPNAPVLITGERGTGKESVARAIHYYSSRRNQPFVPVNSAVLHHDLYAAELFGYRKGAFTGACEDRPGKFRAAQGGTVFLDEISEIPSSISAGLLRVLERGEVQSLGHDHPLQVNVRILAATNRNIGALAHEGKFAADVYDRLNVLTIEVPPLRQRKEDIPLIASYFLRKYCPKCLSDNADAQCRTCFHTAEPQCLDPSLFRSFCNYNWPGNVRELRNVVFRIVAELTSGSETNEVSATARRFVTNESACSDSCELRLDTVVRNHLLRVLEQTNWNQSAAARMIGMPLSTFAGKVKRFGVRRDCRNDPLGPVVHSPR